MELGFGMGHGGIFVRGYDVLKSFKFEREKLENIDSERERNIPSTNESVEILMTVRFIT